MNGKKLEWIRKSLPGRRQQVTVNGKISHYIAIISGVPQGGVLSGLMFILYMNDLPNVLTYLKASLYADDAKFFARASDTDSRGKIQEDLNSVAEWCNTWRLQLNTSKCYLVHYIPKNQHAEYPTYHLNGVRINAKQSVLDLGIIISEDLKFNQQVAAACKKAHREIGIIRRSFISRSPQFLINMFMLFVRPHLNTVYNCGILVILVK